MNLSVIQTENLENEQAALGCYISVNDELLDIITPLTSNSSENLIQVPVTGMLKIMIKDMRKDEILGVLTEDIEQLPKEGARWYTLESRYASQARILISFNNQISGKENAQAIPEREELINKINELQTTVMELEYTLGIEREEKFSKNEEKIINGQTVEKLVAKNNSLKKIIEELNQEKEKLLAEFQSEIEKNKALEIRSNNTFENYSDTAQSIQKSESELNEESCLIQEELMHTQELLQIKISQNEVMDSMIAQLLSKFETLQTSESNTQDLENRLETTIRELDSYEIQKGISQDMLESSKRELEKQQNLLQETIDCYKSEIFDLTSCKNAEILHLQDEINGLHIAADTSHLVVHELKEKVFIQDSEIQCLKAELQGKNKFISDLTANLQEKENLLVETLKETKEITQECSELKKRILDLSKNTDSLEREVTELKCKSITARKLEKLRLDEIDISLENYLSDQGIENLFIKLARGVYLYGTNKVSMSLKQDNTLLCRIGGGYSPIDQFLKLYQNTEIKEFPKYVKKQSLVLSQINSPIRCTQKRAASNTPENSSSRLSTQENQAERSFEKKIIDKLKMLYPLREKNFTPLSRRK